MRTTDEKGQFSAAIDQRVIDAALQSVERREAADDAPAEGSITVEVAPAQPAPEGAQGPAAPPDEPSSAAAARAPTDDALTSLQAQLEASLAHGRELLSKLKVEHERHLRAAADLDNYKKRVQREREEQKLYGHERLLRDLLPVVDNFDRALELARTPDDFASLRKGVEMIRRLFEDALAKHGARAFGAKGLPFDPSVHEAMSQVETGDLPPNHVVTDYVRGFRLHERLLRPALVVVSKAPAEVAPAPRPPAAGLEATAPPAPDAAAPPSAAPESGAAPAPSAAHEPPDAHSPAPGAPPVARDDSAASS